MEKELKIAVLIDAENVSSKYVDIILREAASLGNLIYKRIYGNWTTSLLNSWKTALLDNAIQPIQQYSNTAGKNSSDSALIIDAMDLLYQKHLDAFCIVSSDSDFTRLASRLRESEMYVLGMGEQKTPRAFISACNKFVYLDLLYKASKTDDVKKKPAKPAKKKADATPAEQKTTPEHGAKRRRSGDKPVEESAQTTPTPNEQDEEGFGNGSDILVVQTALRDIAEEFSGDDGWILSASLGARLSKRLPDFDTRNFGFRKFVPFVESLGIFETKSITVSEETGVRTIYFRLIEE